MTLSDTLTPQAREIIRYVALDRGVSAELILGKCRWRHVVLARAEVARHLAYRGYPGTRIAAMLHKHHSAVLYYLGTRGKKLKLRETDKPLFDWSGDMKLTSTQRRELIRLALMGGVTTSKEYAVSLGVSPNYGMVLLQREGRPEARTKRFLTLLDRESRRRPESKKWQRAIAAGPVIA